VRRAAAPHIADRTLCDFRACTPAHLLIGPERCLGRRVQDVMPPDFERYRPAAA